MLKKQKGITLIALVITIIVLLILAGVTIAMVVGDNGILSRSREAKDTTNIKKIQEEVDLEAADLVAEYHTKDSGEVTGSAGEYVATQIDGKTINGIEIEADSEKMTITAEKDGIRTSGMIEPNGHILWNDGNSEVTGGETTTPDVSPSPSPSSTVTITTDNYGDYVDIGVDINGDSDTTNDFRIFLNDESNVYLIAADYIPNSMCPQSEPKVEGRTTKHSLTADGSYKAYWNNDLLADYNGAIDISGNSLLSSNYNKWANRTDLSDTQKGYNHIKAVAYMLDTTAWTSKWTTDYIPSTYTNKINYVVGGPTLEQFSASYNAKHANDTNFDTEVKMNYNENNSYGYFTSRGSGSFEARVSGFSTEDDNLYFIDNSERVSDAMWLASNSNVFTSSLISAHFGGTVAVGTFKSSKYGFRPLVCLKSGVSLAGTDEDGVYELQ
ncbi:MAG: type II secretion system protein [Clostridia bacterium]|nr:type II secretion system protein [Clostridia bacterium]